MILVAVREVAAASAVATPLPPNPTMATLEHTFMKAALALALFAVLAFSVRQDLREHRISNSIVLAGLTCALVLQTLMDGLQGMLTAVAGAGVGLLCFVPLYLSKGMGAGDVKLMAAAGAFFGPADAFVAALLSLAAGAVIAVLVVLWRVFEGRVLVNGTAVASPDQNDATSMQPQLRKLHFPYAAAIATGVLAVMWLRGMLEVFIP